MDVGERVREAGETLKNFPFLLLPPPQPSPFPHSLVRGGDRQRGRARHDKGVEGECERTREHRVVGGIDGKGLEVDGLKGVGVLGV